MSRPSLKGRMGTSLKERVDRDSFFQLSADLPRLVELDVGAIAPNPEQPRLRLDDGTLEELKASIARHGLLQPILVRRAEAGAGWVLVAGQRRLAAVKALGRATVAAILTSGDPGEVALVENLQRQALDPFDTAGAVQRLMERHGYSQAAMGGILGLRQNTVSALLAVNRLPERIRAEYPTSDRVSKSLLVELAAVPDAGEQLRLWDAVRAGGLTVRGVRAARGKGEPPAPRQQPRPAEAAVAEARRLLGRLERLTPATADEPAGAMAELQALHAAIGKRLEALTAGEPQGRKR
jgi:ParB family transcriptional regulator, chromosome partitioning protein